MQKKSDPNFFDQYFLGSKYIFTKILFHQKKNRPKFLFAKKSFHQNFRKLPKNIEVKMKKNQLISAKQPNLIITRNGFDIIVN